MSYLLVDEFNDSVAIETTFRIQNRGIKMGYLRAHCFKSGIITGEFSVTISQNDVVLGSATITADQINDIMGTYNQGMYTWVFDKPVFLPVLEELDEQEYQISFQSSGYVGDASNNFSICKDFDNVFIQNYGVHYNEETPEQNACTMPYGLELYNWDN